MRGRPRKDVVIPHTLLVRRSRDRKPEYYRLKYRQYHLKRAYGLTPEDYERMRAAQGGVCAICQSSHVNALGDPLFVDHDHKTMKIRGLLCHRCNILVGYFEYHGDNIDRVAEYLRIHGSLT